MILSRWILFCASWLKRCCSHFPKDVGEHKSASMPSVQGFMRFVIGGKRAVLRAPAWLWARNLTIHCIGKTVLLNRQQTFLQRTAGSLPFLCVYCCIWCETYIWLHISQVLQSHLWHTGNGDHLSASLSKSAKSRSVAAARTAHGRISAEISEAT